MFAEIMLALLFVARPEVWVRCLSQGSSTPLQLQRDLQCYSADSPLWGLRKTVEGLTPHNALCRTTDRLWGGEDSGRGMQGN
jgi:hypothetical protein